MRRASIKIDVIRKVWFDGRETKIVNLPWFRTGLKRMPRSDPVFSPHLI